MLIPEDRLERAAEFSQAEAEATLALAKNGDPVAVVDWVSFSVFMGFLNELKDKAKALSAAKLFFRSVDIEVRVKV